MHLLIPTKRKIRTSVIFILIGFIFSNISHLTKNASTDYINSVYFEGERLEEYENIIKQNAWAKPGQYEYLSELYSEMPPEAHNKVRLASQVSFWFQVIFGILITYIGACLAHREPKSPRLT
ncbi:hypothetical protein SAMN05216271_2700 [Halopseudomonas sabulinigri]|uniref:Uncharacterized protein n=1 Tax=Halopseudomonas sabulinigri TaxID=472181 RepID=A0A1H1UZA0_9GAMM|nr:hypothetical protein SAMN05216271_2700 [Halopseudomonas sabulinigri]